VSAPVIPPDIKTAAAKVRSPIQRDVIEVALLRYAAGWTRQRIADEAYCNVTSIDNWVIQSEIPRRGSGRPGQARVSDDYVTEVIESYRRTESMRETAIEVGREESTIRKLLFRHAPDLLRPVGGPVPPTPEGWETVADYSIRHQRHKKTVFAALSRGAIPGARRFPQPRHRSGQRWLIPAGTPDVLRTRVQPTAPVDELAARRAPSRPPGPCLPAVEFADWARGTGLSAAELAGGRPTVARAILRMKEGEQETVAVDWADRFFLDRNETLDDIWPDFDAALARGAELEAAQESARNEGLRLANEARAAASRARAA
jgi:hypothetical protein